MNIASGRKPNNEKQHYDHTIPICFTLMVLMLLCILSTTVYRAIVADVALIFENKTNSTWIEDHYKYPLNNSYPTGDIISISNHMHTYTSSMLKDNVNRYESHRINQINSGSSSNIIPIIEPYGVNTTEKIRKPLYNRQRRSLYQPPLKERFRSNDAGVMLPFLGFSAGYQLCTGSLIHPDILLTAAYCQGFFLDGVIVGGTKIDGSDGEFIEVDVELPHPDFLPDNPLNDIMLVKLNRVSNASIVALNFDTEVPSDVDQLSIVGFGSSCLTGSMSAELRQGNVNVISFSDCDSFYLNVVQDLMICTGTVENKYCQGDYGGALLNPNHTVQIGIVSNLETSVGSPSIYTRISGYESFIQNGICKLSSIKHNSCHENTPSFVPTPATTSTAEPTIRKKTEKLSSSLKNKGSAFHATSSALNDSYPFFGFPVGFKVCAGTLIHPDIVLTAASCKGVFVDGVFIGGKRVDGSESNFFSVANEISHPQFIGGELNDIMLVKLTTTSNATMVTLNFNSSASQAGEALKTIGFGSVLSADSVSDELLQKAMTVVSFEDCNTYYLTIVKDKMICAGFPYTSVSQVDSGGPLLTSDNIQIGLISYVDDLPSVPAILTQISGYRKFIQQGICRHSSVPPDSCRPKRASPVSSPSMTLISQNRIAQTNHPSPGVLVDESNFFGASGEMLLTQQLSMQTESLVPAKRVATHEPLGNSKTNTDVLFENINVQTLRSREPKVVGGTPVTDGEFPYFSFPAGFELCGGTLIYPDIVLTAAHCEGVFVDGALIGGTKIDGTQSEFIDVETQYPHPNYIPGPELNDIMLIKLATSSTAPLAQLNFDPNIPIVDEPVTLLGFGATSQGGSLSDDLLQATVNVVSFQDCNDYYSTIDDATMICAGVDDGSRDSCQGDSGGPLLTENNIQVGLVSFGDGCAQPGVPAVYTRISAYEAWIRNGICDLSSNPPSNCTDTVPPTLVTTIQLSTVTPTFRQSQRPSLDPSISSVTFSPSSSATISPSSSTTTTVPTSFLGTPRPTATTTTTVIPTDLLSSVAPQATTSLSPISVAPTLVPTPTVRPTTFVVTDAPSVSSTLIPSVVILRPTTTTRPQSTFSPINVSTRAPTDTSTTRTSSSTLIPTNLPSNATATPSTITFLTDEPTSKETAFPTDEPTTKESAFLTDEPTLNSSIFTMSPSPSTPGKSVPTGCPPPLILKRWHDERSDQPGKKKDSEKETHKSTKSQKSNTKGSKKDQKTKSTKNKKSYKKTKSSSKGDMSVIEELILSDEISVDSSESFWSEIRKNHKGISTTGNNNIQTTSNNIFHRKSTS